MLISLFPTPFDHFHFHTTLGLDPALILTLRPPLRTLTPTGYTCFLNKTSHLASSKTITVKIVKIDPPGQASTGTLGMAMNAAKLSKVIIVFEVFESPLKLPTRIFGREQQCNPNVLKGFHLYPDPMPLKVLKMPKTEIWRP